MINADSMSFLNTRRFTVLFSGGKDSLASLLWVLNNVQHERWKILYIEIPGNTHPLCTQYVKDVTKKLGVHNKLIIDGRYDLDFMDMLQNYGCPLVTKYRWCFFKFKAPVMEKYKAYSLVQVTGMRRTDSTRRRSLKQIDYYQQTGFITVNPLWNWDKKRVLEYIRHNKIPLNPCYKLYGHSGNCMFCPMMSKKNITLTLRDPEWREKIMRALSNARGKTSKQILEKWQRIARIVENDLTTWLR